MGYYQHVSAAFALHASIGNGATRTKRESRLGRSVTVNGARGANAIAENETAESVTHERLSTTGGSAEGCRISTTILERIWTRIG